MRKVVVLCVVALASACGGESPLAPGPLPNASRLSGATASVGPVAFASNRSGSMRIYVADADGSNVTAIATGDDPAWAPGGHQIAFTMITRVCIINADGSNLRKLRPGRMPAWSPDGTKIVFHTDDEMTQGGGLFVMNADGSGVAKLIGNDFTRPEIEFPDDSGVFDPSWSPDGRKIAFLRGSYYEPRRIYVMNADGSSPELVSAPFVFVGGGPTWSADGLRLLLYGGGTIASVDMSGSGLQVLVQAPGASNPAWLPDGRSILFSRFTGPPDATNGLGSGIRIFVADGIGAQRQLISEAPTPAVAGYSDRQAVWAR